MSVFVSLIRNTRVPALNSGLNQIPHKPAANFGMYVVQTVQTSWDIQTDTIFIRACDWKVWEGGGGGTRDTGLVTVDNLVENPAR